MRNTKYFFGVLVLLLLLSSSLSALDYIYPAKVERVVDGDTIVVRLALGLDVVLEHQWIRLYDINAWEPKGEQKEKGLEATKYLEERLSKGQIEIEIRPEWSKDKTGKGKYGRWIGIVYIDGVNVNVELIEKGHAEKYEEGES